METQSLVTIVPWQFIFTLLNLLIQILLIKKFLFKPINNILEQRQALADKDIRDAEAARKEAAQIKAEYEAGIADAQARAAEIVQNAQREAQSRTDEMVREAAAQVTDMKAQAEADIAQERKKAVNEIKDEIGGLAMDIAGKVVEKEIHASDHSKLIDEFIRNVGDAV